MSKKEAQTVKPIREGIKNNPRLLGMLAGFLVLLMQTGVVAAGAGASTMGP